MLLACTHNGTLIHFRLSHHSLVVYPFGDAPCLRTWRSIFGYANRDVGAVPYAASKAMRRALREISVASHLCAAVGKASCYQGVDVCGAKENALPTYSSVAVSYRNNFMNRMLT